MIYTMIMCFVNVVIVVVVFIFVVAFVFACYELLNSWEKIDGL